MTDSKIATQNQSWTGSKQVLTFFLSILKTENTQAQQQWAEDLEDKSGQVWLLDSASLIVFSSLFSQLTPT